MAAALTTGSPRGLSGLASLRKALADAVHVEHLLGSNPAERSKRPRNQHASEPARVWTADQLCAFLAAAKSHRLYAFYHLAVYTGRGVVSCSTSAGRRWTSTRPRLPSAGQPPSCAASVSRAPPTADVPGPSAST